MAAPAGATILRGPRPHEWQTHSEMAVTRQSAIQVIVRTALSRADKVQILALPYPVEDHAFWQVLAGLGVTQERLMDRMGAGP
jgi:hypothetical protein